MRRELFIHTAFWFSFFVFVAIARHYFALPFWQFWLGGIVGIFLPDIDHIIYVFFVKPQELTSQRVNYYLGNREIKKSIAVMYDTRSERGGLIFHTIFFQLIFWVLTFLMVTSSGVFGKGLVLSFALHLIVDQVMDLTELHSFDNWLKDSPIKLDFEKAKIYWAGSLALLLIFGFLI